MIWSVATGRQATAFAQALDEHELEEAPAAGQAAGKGAARVHPQGTATTGTLPETDRGHDGTDGANGGADTSEPALLLAVSDRLGALPKPELAPAAKTVQRAQLIAAMEAAAGSPETRADQLPGQRGARSGRGSHRAPNIGPLDAFRPKSRLAKGLAAGGLSVGVAASALGGFAAASTGALPGDSLYGLKRGMEDLQLDLADDETGRGEVHLDHASTRLREARRLLERTRGGAVLDHESLGEVRKALSGMRYDATEGHRLLSGAYERNGELAPMRSLSSFSTGHRASWAQLRDRLPAQLADVGDDVSSVFDAIDSDVGPLAGLLSDPSQDGSGERGRGGAGGTGGSGTSPLPPSSGSSDTDSRDGGRDGRPSPTGSDQGAGELIGGGILDPSGNPDGNPSQSESGDDRGKRFPDPDVTLPPIIPDVLPGLKKLPGDERS
ncbi:MAG: DUF5667 domain-containing protein [Streptomyces sp.]|uniref:DUF5667 domain-containing protein n=1 Tax=Streptomyces sp. TaxID=1931 RepID=UPI003D6C1FBA